MGVLMISRADQMIKHELANVTSVATSLSLLSAKMHSTIILTFPLYGLIIYKMIIYKSKIVTVLKISLPMQCNMTTTF